MPLSDSLGPPLNIEIEPLLDDSDEHVDRDGDPNLALYGVFGSTEKALDAKMLLDPLEEQFDLPAVLVKRTDCQCRELKMIGEKHQGLAGFGILESDATQVLRIMLAGVETIERNCLVADQTGTAVVGAE
jgi:hypothetical protein